MQRWLALLLLVALKAHAGPQEDIAAVLDRFHAAAAGPDPEQPAAALARGPARDVREERLGDRGRRATSS